MAILLFVAGVLLGWAVPQPAWAKVITDKIAKFFTNGGKG